MVQPHDTQQRDDSPIVGYHDVSQLITRDFVEMNKSSMTVTDLQSFVKVRGDRALRGGKLTFFNVPKGKEQLLIRFFEVKDNTVIDPVIVSVPTSPVLLEPSMHSFDV